MRRRSMALSKRLISAVPEYWVENTIPVELTVSTRTHWTSMAVEDPFSMTTWKNTRSIGTMLRALFIRCADDTESDGIRASSNDLWEGLAVVAGYVAKDSSELSGMVDELRMLAAARRPAEVK